MVIAAHEQLYAQLVLQLRQLARNGGLRNVQQLCGAGDVFLAGNGQKIAKYGSSMTFTFLLFYFSMALFNRQEKIL